MKRDLALGLGAPPSRGCSSLRARRRLGTEILMLMVLVVVGGGVLVVYKSLLDWLLEK